MAESPQKETFSVATTVEDPMTAESLVEALLGQSIDAFVRARGSAGNDALGAATTGFGYWEILVPTPQVEAAARLIETELATLETDAEANAQAAEEEAMSGENAVPEK
jgi:hypothetical protein